jgi:hypothetical protein
LERFKKRNDYKGNRKGLIAEKEESKRKEIRY